MRQNTSNQDIRRRAAAIGCPLWKLASAAGINDSTLSKWMRLELNKMDPRRVKLLIALSELEKEAAKGAEHGRTEEKVDGATV